MHYSINFYYQSGTELHQYAKFLTNSESEWKRYFHSVAAVQTCTSVKEVGFSKTDDKVSSVSIITSYPNYRLVRKFNHYLNDCKEDTDKMSYWFFPLKVTGSVESPMDYFEKLTERYTNLNGLKTSCLRLAKENIVCTLEYNENKGIIMVHGFSYKRQLKLFRKTIEILHKLLISKVNGEDDEQSK